MSSDKPRFAGYGQPRYTNIPDQFLDEQFHSLSECELKVMLYIFRHTFGFKKSYDAISHSQFVTGIVTRDGRRLDHGAGVSLRGLRRALDTLVGLSYIFKHLRYDTNGNHLTTIYELNIDGYPHLEDNRDGGTGKLPGVGTGKLPGAGTGNLPDTKNTINNKHINNTHRSGCDVPAAQSQEIQSALEAAGLSSVSASKLVTVLGKNGRNLDYISSWQSAISRQQHIINPAAYLKRMILENAGPPPPATGQPKLSHQQQNRAQIEQLKAGLQKYGIEINDPDEED